MSDLKKAWKKTAKSFILAANDLGEALIDSVKVGKEKVITWAQTNDDPIHVEAAEIHTEEGNADNSEATE